MEKQKAYRLLNNSRFYVLASALLASLLVVAVLRLQISSDQLFYIRMQQVFGLLCLLYWYAALIISPIGYVIGAQRVKHFAFARRGIGVAAFYFALLHVVVALWAQFGGLGQLQYLPVLFQRSLLAGAAALAILSLLAVTSFDKVISAMTFRRWKWLQRFIYVAGVLAVLHVWSVGTHLAYSYVQLAAFAALVLLAGLETYRGVKLFAKRYPEFKSWDYFTAIFLAVWTMWIVLIALIPVTVQNYHSRHEEQSGRPPIEARQ